MDEDSPFSPKEWLSAFAEESLQLFLWIQFQLIKSNTKDLQVAFFCVEISKIEENNLIDQAISALKQVLDNPDPIYQVLLLDLSICSNFDYCLYNNNMVKKLRNR